MRAYILPPSVLLLAAALSFGQRGTPMDAGSLRGKRICNPLAFTGTNVHLIWNNSTGCLAAGLIVGGVTSVFGRTGAVTAQSGDYTAAQVTNAFDKSTNNDIGANWVDATAGSAPANPSAGKYRMYFKTGTGICQRDNSGTEVCLNTGSIIVSMTSSTRATIAAHTASNGAVLTTIAAGTCDISAGSGTAYIQEAADGTVICGHNGLTLACNANCTVQAAVTGPINGYKQLGSCAATTGAWTSCTDVSQATGFQRVAAGSNISLSYDAAGTATVALAGTVDLTSVPTTIPNSNTLPASCTEGQIYKDNNATSGSQIYACEGTTWVLQGGSSVTKVRIPVPIMIGSLSAASSSSLNCAASTASMADADMNPAFGVKFAHTGTPTMDCVYRLPLNWDGTALTAYLSVGPNSTTSGTTGVLYVTNVCVAAGSTYSSGTFGGSVTYTFTGLDAGAATLREATGDITPDAGTCVAGRTIKFRIARTGGVGADDFNPSFNLTNFQIGVRVNLE